MDRQFVHDPAAMAFGGFYADPEDLRDLLRSVALRNQLKDAPFLSGQELRGSPRPRQISLEYGSGDAGAEVHMPGAQLVNRPDEIPCRLRFHDVAPDTCTEGFVQYRSAVCIVSKMILMDGRSLRISRAASNPFRRGIE